MALPWVDEMKAGLKSWLPGRRHEYTAVPGDRDGDGQAVPLEDRDAEADAEAADVRREGGFEWGPRMVREGGLWYKDKRQFVKVAAIVVLFFLLMHIGAVYRRDKGPSMEDPGDFRQLWGQYSPFFPVPSEIDDSVPAGCEVNMVQVLSRHGSRDPTAHKSDAYRELVRRIQDGVGAEDYGEHFEFIREYEYSLGKDQLTPYGQHEMYDSGAAFYRRYKDLVKKGEGGGKPFIRVSGQERVIVSGRNWADGFYRTREEEEEKEEDEDDDDDDDDEEEDSDDEEDDDEDDDDEDSDDEDDDDDDDDDDEEEEDDDNKGKDYLDDILIIPEEPGVNNSLNHGQCPAFESDDGPNSQIGASAQKAWLGVFAPPITERLNLNLPGANLSDAETVYLMDLCPFNTVADKNLRQSPFCGLFTRDEWQSYAYFESLGKYYGYGNGNPLGPSQGVGFVNELVARLTGEPVADGTTTNSTLDGDEGTFPLEGRKVFADFSHDNDMMAVYGALGLYNGTEALPEDERRAPEEAGGFSAAWTVPFGARMYVERMTCGVEVEGDEDAKEDDDNGGGGGGEGDGEEEDGEKGKGGQKQEMVRVLVNDRVVPLVGCDADDLGRCRLDAFVDGLEFARNGGRWDECFE